MKFFDLFFSARPLLHLPIWSVYLVALRYRNQLSYETFGWGNIAALAILSLMAAGAFWLNQVYDRESDALNNKIGFIQRGYLTVKMLLWCAAVATVLGLALSYWYSGTLFLICLQGAALTYIYSAPPLRLKDRPISGMLANAYAFGFLISVSVQPHINAHTIGLIGWDNPYYFFLSVASVHVITTLPDLAGDSRTGKRTMAVTWGRVPSLVTAFALMLLAVWVAWYTGHMILVAIAAVSVVSIVVNLVVKSAKLELLSAKLPILLLTVLAAWYYPFYALFIIALICATRIYYRKRFGMTYPQIA